MAQKKKVQVKSQAGKAKAAKAQPQRAPAVKAKAHAAAPSKSIKKPSETKKTQSTMKATPKAAAGSGGKAGIAKKPAQAAKIQATASVAKPIASKAGAAKPAAAKPVIAKAAADKPVLAKQTVASPLPVRVAQSAAAKPVAATVGQIKPVMKPAVQPATVMPAAMAPHPMMSRPAAPAAHAVARTVPSAFPKPAVKSFAAPLVPRDIAAKAAELRQAQALAASKKPVSQRHGFKTNEFIVYPAHGVGRIVGIEEQEIAGMSLELFVIQFEKDKMTLRVPTGKLQSVGMRKLAEDEVVSKAMETLKGRARVKRTMWSRRAQEYEAKINSGDLVSIAEVVRDLYRSENQPEQSYSERQLYEAALDRMAREIAAVARLDERGAVQKITEVLSKSAKGRRLAADAAEAAVSGDVKAA